MRIYFRNNFLFSPELFHTLLLHNFPQRNLFCCSQYSKYRYLEPFLIFSFTVFYIENVCRPCSTFNIHKLTNTKHKKNVLLPVTCSVHWFLLDSILVRYLFFCRWCFCVGIRRYKRQY